MVNTRKISLCWPLYLCDSSAAGTLWIAAAHFMLAHMTVTAVTKKQMHPQEEENWAAVDHKPTQWTLGTQSTWHVDLSHAVRSYLMLTWRKIRWPVFASLRSSGSTINKLEAPSIMRFLAFNLNPPWTFPRDSDLVTDRHYPSLKALKFILNFIPTEY